MGSVQQQGDGSARCFLVDDEGRGLRATWRERRGFVNLSLWHDERCVETFHLEPVDAGRLVSFLATSLMAAVPSGPPLRAVDTAPVSADDGRIGCAHRSIRLRLAQQFEGAARRLRG